VSPQPTADCQPSRRLLLGMALSCGLTSVRGDREENYEIARTMYRKKSFFPGEIEDDFHTYS
jgi:hypothetical protein